ncbi:MAG: magnesium transporter [Alphaproteobacteria bacterium]
MVDIKKDEKITEQDTEALDELVGLSEESVSNIIDALEDGDFETVQKIVTPLQAVDVADLYQQLSQHQREQLLDILGDDLDGEIISHLDDSMRDDVLKNMRPKPLAKLLEDLETDDAIYLIEDLEEDKQKAVLRYTSREDRAIYEEALSYADETAARIMRHEMVVVPEIWTVGHIIDMLRDDRDDLPDSFNSVIVVGRGSKPKGVVVLSKILTSSRKTTVKKLLTEETLYPIPADMPQEDVAYLFKQYDLIEAPVVNDDGKLIGVITVDDIVDIIEEEAEDDLLKLGGVIEDDLYQDIFSTAKLRFPWLLVNLITAIVASMVISLYTDAIEKVVALAILMPIVASMGGNAGTQTLTVAVRAIATNELTSANAFRIVWKESLVGGINGILFAIISGLGVYLWFNDMVLGAVISIAMIVNLLVAGLAGIIVPITLEKMNSDPAVSSTVFLTTITDVVGFFVFLGIASLALY